jgi:two-component system sensor histidine kinase UhpB
MKRLREKLLNLSILYKILIANTFIIVVGAVVGTWLTRELSQRSAPEELIYIFVLAGIILSISVNFFIIKAALQPLANLQKTVEAVYRGDLMARAARTPLLGDPTINRLRDALNSMLEELSTSHKRLAELSTKVLNAREEERKRVARELHDETSQALTLLLIELKMLEKAKPEDRKKKLTELWAYTSQILDGVRRLTLELRPSDLDELGLIPALRSYTKDWSKKFNIGIDFQATRPRGKLPNNVEVALYRVVQEALTNVAKHSGATSVWISMRCEDSLGVVTIRDNGRGFNMDEVMKSKESGLGLFGMRERMSTVGGELKINTTPGQGTEVVAKYTYRENDGG